MRKRLLGAFATLWTATGLAVAQPPAPAVEVPPAALPAQAPPAAASAAAAVASPVPPVPIPESVCGEAGRLPPYFALPPEDPIFWHCLWVRPEYLLAWTKHYPVPVPLVTVNTVGNPGALNQPGTKVVIGQQDIDSEIRHGGRLTAGCFLDHCHTWALEGSYFYLVERSVGRTVGSSGQPGSPLLSIPFFDVTTAMDSATFLANPGRFAGTATLTMENWVQGAEINFLYDLSTSMGIGIHLLGGFRYVNVHENLTFATSSPNIPPAPADVFRTSDGFRARNHYIGPQAGVRLECAWGAWFVNCTTKFSIGGMSERVDIDGVLLTNDVTNFGPVVALPGGYFAQPTNTGTYDRNRFAFVPEGEIHIGYQLTHWARIFAGYSVLYLSEIARPGNQIDPWINPTQSPAIGGFDTSVATFVGQPRPSFNLNLADFWVQAVNLGFELRY